MVEDARQFFCVKVDRGEGRSELREFMESVRMGGTFVGRGRFCEMDPILAVLRGPF